MAASADKGKDQLTIGQMAARNAVSKKTLRLYHEMGLIEPKKVDEHNGRRYYSVDQSYQIDLIQRLQSIGVPLADIKNALKDPGDELLAHIVKRQLQRIEIQQRELGAAHTLALELATGIRKRKLTPNEPGPLPGIHIEHRKASHVLVFTCDELEVDPFDLSVCDRCGTQWHIILGRMKERVAHCVDEMGLDMPIPLIYQKTGFVFSQQDHDSGLLTAHRVFTTVPDGFEWPQSNYVERPEGDYLFISGNCTNYVDACHGKCSCAVASNELLSLARRQALSTDGLCFAESQLDPLDLKQGKTETLFDTSLRLLD